MKNGRMRNHYDNKKENKHMHYVVKNYGQFHFSVTAKIEMKHG